MQLEVATAEGRNTKRRMMDSHPGLHPAKIADRATTALPLWLCRLRRHVVRRCLSRARRSATCRHFQGSWPNTPGNIISNNKAVNSERLMKLSLLSTSFPVRKLTPDFPQNYEYPPQARLQTSSRDPW